MTFDLRTAYLLLGVMCFTAAAGVYAALRVRLDRGHLQWVAGGAVFGGACLALAYRYRIPDPLSFEGSFICLVGGQMLHARALWEATGRRPPWFLSAATLLVLLAGYVGARQVHPAYGMALSTACNAVASAVTIVAALRLWLRRRQAGAAVVACAFAFLLTGLLVRAWFLPGSWSRGGVLEADVPQITLILSGFMTIILAQVGYLGLQFDEMLALRLRSERAAATEAERARQTAQRETQLRGLLEERNQMIQRLAQSEAVEDLAQFATTLPHELSQPLCASQLTLETLVGHLAARGDDVALEAARALAGNNDRVLDMLKQLRILLRTHEESPRETLDLCRLVERTLPVLQASFRDAGVTLRVDLPAEPVWVDARTTQLQQALLVLCAQARDTARASGGAGPACSVGVVRAADGERVGLSVQGGPEPGPADGQVQLGMAIARRIAQAHHGWLEVAEGQVLRLWLPVRPADAGP